MPTNLPPEYYDAEDQYKAASSPEEKIKRLEELISTVPKHKGTDKLRADLRKRLSKLKTAAQSKKGASRHVSAFHVDKEGAGQVPLIGTPNVGKSALVTALTNASPEVAIFPHTTWTVNPGMMLVDHAPIQLVDTPPLHKEYIEPALMDLIRRSDLLLLVVDLQADPIEQLEETLALLAEHRIRPIHLQYENDQEARITFLPVLVVVNKYDDEQFDEDFEILQELLEGKWPLIPVSATTGRNLDELRNTVFERLELIRVYSKPPGADPDRTKPFVLAKGSTVEDFAAKVHHDFFNQLKSARIWGSGAFQGQVVSRDHELWEGDIIELRI
jgi:ribosome-interacting GTPase 1